MVQQIGHGYKQHPVTLRQPEVGDRRRQMGFAAAIIALKQQPPVRLERVAVRKVEADAQRRKLLIIEAVQIQLEALEGLVGQGVEIAELAQPRGLALAQRVALADAGERFAKVGMLDRDILDNKAHPAADRASRPGRPAIRIRSR